MNFLKLPSKLCTGDVSKSPCSIPEKERDRELLPTNKEKDRPREKLHDRKTSKGKSGKHQTDIVKNSRF